MTTLRRAASSVSRRPTLSLLPAHLARRTLCLPPGPSIRYSAAGGESAPPREAEDQDIFELMSTAKTACPSECDGITPEAALQELRRLTPELAQLGIHRPTPVAPFTDVDPITGEMAPKKTASFFSRSSLRH